MRPISPAAESLNACPRMQDYGRRPAIFGYFADRTSKPVVLLICTQFTAALFALGCSQVLGNSQLFFAKLLSTFQGNFALQSFLKGVIVFVFMILPTLCLGATFPLVNKIYTQRMTSIGRSIGFAYMINTIGAVLGSFCAGFVLIPFLGKETSLSLVISFQIISSLIISFEISEVRTGTTIAIFVFLFRRFSS